MCAVKVQKMELGEPDESGRRRPVPIEGAIEEIPCDVAISAIGTNANPFAKKIGGQDGAQQVGLHRRRRGDRPDHRSPHLGRAATSSPVPLRSFWRWAPAKKAAASITKSLLGE